MLVIGNNPCRSKLFLDIAVFSSNIFRRYHSWGIQLWSFKSTGKKYIDIFTDHVQMVNKRALIFESLIDHAYIKKRLME